MKSLNVKLKNPMTHDELVENTGFERIYYGVPSSEIISAEVKEEETVDTLNSDIINELTAKMIIEGKMEVATSGAYSHSPCRCGREYSRQSAHFRS